MNEHLEALIAYGSIKELDDVVDEMTPIPWVGKTCADCPFFERSHVAHATSGGCRVFSRSTRTDAPTCAYFDPGNHDLAREVMAKRPEMTRPQWERWLAENRIPQDTNER